jgi:tRNA (cmo5U34)-methyltransferase
MLAKAAERLAAHHPALVVADMNDALPAGEFDVIMSALAIHHLEHAQKRDLFARVHRALAPGGMFVNAEQMLAPEQWQQELWKRVHLDTARSLGSDVEEIARAVELMKQDRCATLDAQLGWLREAGFARAGGFFQWFHFAVYAAWKAPARELL